MGNNGNILRVKLVNDPAAYEAVKNSLVYEIGSRKKNVRRQSVF
jgi:hypothetical protein